MALENKKLSTYDDLLSLNIDTTTKLVVLTGATKVNANLPVTNFIEDSLTSSSVVKPLSAAKGKSLQDTKAPIANPTFTGTVGGVTKAMVGLSNVDNTSDAGKPISTAQAAGLAPKANPVFTGTVTVGSSQEHSVIVASEVNTDDGTSSINTIATSPDESNYISISEDRTTSTGIEVSRILFTQNSKTIINSGVISSDMDVPSASSSSKIIIGSSNPGINTKIRGSFLFIEDSSSEKTDGTNTYSIRTYSSNSAALTASGGLPGMLYTDNTGAIKATYIVN